MHIGTTVVHYTFRMAYPVNSACCQVALLTRLAVVSVTKWMTWWGWMLWINRVWVWHADMLKLTCLYSMISMIVWCYVISGKSFWHLPTWLLIPLCSFLLQGHYPCAVTLHLLTSPQFVVWNPAPLALIRHCRCRFCFSLFRGPDLKNRQQWLHFGKGWYSCEETPEVQPDQDCCHQQKSSGVSYLR